MDCDSGLPESSSESNGGPTSVAGSTTSEGTSAMSGSISSSILDGASGQTSEEELSSMFETLSNDYSLSVVTLTEELREQRQDLIMYYETLLKVQEEKWGMIVADLLKEIEELHVDNQHMKTSLSYREINKCQVCHADCIVTPTKNTCETQTNWIDMFHSVRNKPRGQPAKNSQCFVTCSNSLKPEKNIFPFPKNYTFSFTPPVLKAAGEEVNIVTKHTVAQSSDSSRDSALETDKSHLKTETDDRDNAETGMFEKLELVFDEEKMVKLRNLFQKYKPPGSSPATDAQNTVVKTSEKDCKNNGQLARAVGNLKHGDNGVAHEGRGESHNTNPSSFLPTQSENDKGPTTDFAKTPVFTLVGHKVSH